MSGNEPGKITIKQMMESFWRRANPNRPGRKIPSEVRVAYYAGCHAMMDEMLAMLRVNETTPGARAATWQGWAYELGQFVQDYNAGKV